MLPDSSFGMSAYHVENSGTEPSNVLMGVDGRRMCLLFFKILADFSISVSFHDQTVLH